jgi:hypothetical protein
MTISTAIIVAGALIAISIAFVARWEISGAFRLDRWTGQVVECNATSAKRVDGFGQGIGLEFNCAQPKAP